MVFSKVKYRKNHMCYEATWYSMTPSFAFPPGRRHGNASSVRFNDRMLRHTMHQAHVFFQAVLGRVGVPVGICSCLVLVRMWRAGSAKSWHVRAARATSLLLRKVNTWRFTSAGSVSQ